MLNRFWHLPPEAQAHLMSLVKRWTFRYLCFAERCANLLFQRTQLHNSGCGNAFSEAFQLFTLLLFLRLH